MVRFIIPLALLASSLNACKSQDAQIESRVAEPKASVGTSNSHASESTATGPRVPTVEEPNMIQGRPVFELRVDIESCPHEVYVNGGLVERNFEAIPAHIEYQVNQYLRSGRNDIEVQMIQFESEPSECDVKLQLRYLDMSAPADAQPITLLTVAHDAKAAPAADMARGSSPSGSYDSSTGLPRDAGDVQIGPASVVSLSGQIRSLKQTIDLTLPFPEWAFLRSEQLTLDWKLTDEAERARAYEALLVRYNELHALLEKHDVDSFLDACEERSRELDVAYYKSPGETRRGLDQNLRQAMTDSKLELASLYKAPGKRWGYMTGSKGTLVALTQGKRASPIFRYQMKDDVPFSQVFPVLFRKEKGKFIITR